MTVTFHILGKEKHAELVLVNLIFFFQMIHWYLYLYKKINIISEELIDTGNIA